MDNLLSSLGSGFKRFGRRIGDVLTPEEEAALAIQPDPAYPMPTVLGPSMGVEQPPPMSAPPVSVLMPERSQPSRAKSIILAGIQGAVDGASTPNIAYGGGTDIMRAASNASEMARQRQMQSAQLDRQRTNDAYLRNRDQRADAQLTEMQRAAKMRESLAQAKLDQEAEKTAEAVAQDIVENGRGEFVSDPSKITDEQRPLLKKYVIGGQARYVRMFTNEEKADREYQAKVANLKRAGIEEGTEAWKKGMLGAAYLAPEKPVEAKALVARDYTDETTGTVTRIWFDQMTGKEVKRDTIEGVAKKRPPAGPSSEPGTWTPEVDEYGNIVRYRNNKTLEAQTPDDVGNRKTPLAAGERKDLAGGQSVVENLNELERLATKAKGSIGPISGRVTQLQRATVGGVSDETSQLFQLSGMIADDLLRIKSGAQINEQEMKRLQQLVPLPTQPYETFMVNLNKLRDETNRLLKNRSTKTKNPAAPPEQTAQPTAQRIRMTSPQGVTGTVPASMRQQYESRGYKLAQ